MVMNLNNIDLYFKGLFSRAVSCINEDLVFKYKYKSHRLNVGNVLFFTLFSFLFLGLKLSHMNDVNNTSLLFSQKCVFSITK